MSIGDKLLKSAAAGGLTPSENFKAVKFSGNGSAGRAGTVGFRPDYIVVKKISGSDNWRAVDTTRGLEYINYWNLTNAQDGSSGSPYLSVSDTGFATTSNGNDNFNASGSDYVAYCWKANGGTTSSNGDGNITSTVQANTDAGFSIVKYSGTGSNVQVGHGLGAAPTMVIFKNLTDSVNWYVWTTATGSLIRLEGLNTNSAAVTSGLGTTLGASTIDFTNTSDFSTAGKDYIMYCFRDIDAYSKIGSYTGDRTNDVIVETGFEVGWVMIKAADATDDWFIISQETGNTQLYANNSNAESAFTGVSFLSNGFMLNGSANSGGTNNAGTTFIYMAFATDPDTEAPTLANSFNIKTYTGTGSNKSIAGYGFAPNFLWIKQRSGTEQHYAYDTIRGYSKYLHTNLANAEGTDTSSRLASFDSDGFSLFTDAAVNGSGSTYVAWGWKANDDVPTINDNGSIDSLVSANANAGFSIVKYTGTGSNLTVGHGLSSAPDFVIVKNLTSSSAWAVFHTTLGATKYLALNESTAVATASNVWNDTAPTATTISVGTWGPVNTSANQHIAYCFHDVTGYSKISSYTGNGGTLNVTGLGFQPDWVIIKETDGVDSWQVYDSVRGAGKVLYPNGNNAEYAGSELSSFDSDGFTVTGNPNENGKTYIYMAFKRNLSPFPRAGNMSFLVIAAGGGGGFTAGGGGGAGGLRTSYGDTSGGGSSSETDITLAAGTYTITIGSGGAGSGSGSARGTSGGDSSIAASGLTTITSTGGGGGGTRGSGIYSGLSGGSGGGEAGDNSGDGGAGTANQGYAGGSNSDSGTGGAGGGGASAVGSAHDGNNGGNGGAGLAIEITGSSVAYAGGGGGGGQHLYSGGTGGSGGGGNGGTNNAGSNGTANTGGGAGGDGNFDNNGGTGGSGVVILRLLTSEYSSSVTGSPTVTTDGDYTILKYTGSGTYVHS